MAFGNLSSINVGIGLLARPFVTGVKNLVKATKTTMKQVGAEVRKGVQVFRNAASKTKGKNSFLSPEWFKQRARWFIQLRLFWTLWQSLSQAVAGAFEFEQEMANVRAITQATHVQFEALRAKALEVGKTTRFSASEAAKGMVVMSQAGLSAKEVIESITAVADLAVATMNDFKDTASLVVTIMRAWKKPAESATEITDILATSINKTKLNMEALANGFKFVSGIAPQMGVSLEETTALLGVLANRGLSASVAATSLRAFMAALLNPTDKFKAVLKRLNVELEDVDPRVRHMSSILETLRQAGFGTAEAFEAFRRRAAAGASILIGASKEFLVLSKNMNQSGRAAQMAAINLDTVQGQTKQLQDVLVALAADLNKDTEPALKSLAQATKLVATTMSKAIKPITTLVKLIAGPFSDGIKILTRGMLSANTDRFAADMLEINNKMAEQIDKGNDLVTKIRDIRTAYAQWTLTAKEAMGEVDGILRPELLEKGLKAIKDAGFLTQREFEAIMDNTEMAERRERAEQAINDRIRERETDLKGQWAIAKRTAEALELAAVQMALPGISPSFYALTDAMEDFTKSGKNFKDAFTARDSKPAKNSPFSLFVGGTAIEKAEKGVFALKKLEKVFGEFFTSGRIAGDGMIAMWEKHNPLLAKFTTIAKKSQGDFKRFVELLDESKNTQKEIVKVTKEENKVLEEKLGKTAKGVTALKTETPAAAKKRINAKKKLLEMDIKLLKADLKRLVMQEDAVEREAKESNILDMIRFNKEEILDLDRQSNVLGGMSVEDSWTLLQNESNLLDKAFSLNDVLRARQRIAQKIKDIQAGLKGEIARLKHAAELEELRGNKEIDRLASEQEIFLKQREAAEKQIEQYQILQGLTAENQKIKDLKEEIVELDNNIAINLEKQKLATDAIARNLALYKSNSLDVQSIGEAFNAKGGIIDTLISAGDAGLQNVLKDITSLFSEQREEANKLEAELAGLNTEYQKAMSDGNIERAEQLKNQMAGLRNQIDDLNNPLKNLANSFKKFALTVVEELQKVIIKMLVVKFIGMLLGMFTGGDPGMGNMSFGNQGLDSPFQLPFARGGVMPGGTFKNFRKFARGGVTSGAGMALLGDNASGKELVIPSENIKNDSVSGEVRDSKQPINIINVLTDQDIAAAMARAPGQKTIINTIGQDIGKRGPTYRAIKS